jgi:hypothetical protein
LTFTTHLPGYPRLPAVPSCLLTAKASANYNCAYDAATGILKFTWTGDAASASPAVNLTVDGYTNWLGNESYNVQGKLLSNNTVFYSTNSINHTITALSSTSIALPAASTVGQTGTFNLSITSAVAVNFPADIIVTFPNSRSNSNDTTVNEYVSVGLTVNCTRSGTN